MKAKGLPTRYTILAETTRRAQPWNGDPVSLSEVFNSLPDPIYETHSFVTRNERWIGFNRPVTVCCMNIGMAKTGCFNLYHYLAISRNWNRYILDS